jgi:hypothetical protein
MPSRTRRAAGALLALLAAAALTAQSPAPHVPGGANRQHAHHSGTYPVYPNVIIYGAGYGVTPVATATPKHRATPRPANAPEIFETHSSTDAQ